MMSGITARSACSESDACHVCGEAALDDIPDFSAFRRVTSDCRPWPAGGRLCICGSCGCVQSPADAAFLRDAAAIYAGYAIYHQSGGAEQAVFNASGQAVSRSSRLVESLRSHLPLPPKARLLDVGCGNGATLRAFSEAEPGWSLAGIELDDRNRRQIESIPRVESLHTCALQVVPGCFDVVTMVHVLEHVPRPAEFLAHARDKLTGDGLLIVEVPDYTRNPFELLIADHCTHFSAATAALLLPRAGYAPAVVAEGWVPRELTVVARVAATPPPLPRQATLPAAIRESVEDDLRWLSRVIGAARAMAQRGPFGLFGTSIAAAWLFGEFEGAVSFFVDEDPNRVGNTCLGRPVYHPSQVPAGSRVLLALPAEVAVRIHSRIARGNVVYVLPPAR